MRKRIFAGFLALALMFSFTACQSGNINDNDKDDNTDETEKITFCLDWTPNTNHTGLYVAKNLGYFKDAGLDVEIVQPGESTAALVIGSGQAQFGIECQDTMAAALIGDAPLGITAVAAILQHNTSGIMSLKGSGIDSPKGLSGKTYSTWDSPIELATLESVVTADGGDFSTVKLIPNTITDEPAALKEHQTDAIWVFYGWGGIYAELQGVEIDFFQFADIDEVFDYYTPCIVANDEYLENNPEEAKAFMQAVKKGYEYAIANPKEAADILMEEVTELKGSSDLIYASQEWISAQYQADADSWGEIDPDRWNAFYRWLTENDLVESPLSDGMGFSNDYL